MRRPREVGFEVAPGLMGLSNIGIVFGHVGDLLLLARLALEAAIPNENVLIELLSPDLAAMSALPGGFNRLAQHSNLLTRMECGHEAATSHLLFCGSAV